MQMMAEFVFAGSNKGHQHQLTLAAPHESSSIKYGLTGPPQTTPNLRNLIKNEIFAGPGNVVPLNPTLAPQNRLGAKGNSASLA
jgi:hypothetical protein